MVIIYFIYCHREVGSGNWCFSDGTLSIEELLQLCNGCYYPTIFSDCCYSGHWANYCLVKSDRKEDYVVLPCGLYCVSACSESETALDTANGGDFTLYITGKKEQPRRVPLYSGGNRLVFPIV